MNCARCHHSGEAHADSAGASSIVRRGRCAVPGCACAGYADEMERIDEELL